MILEMAFGANNLCLTLWLIVASFCLIVLHINIFQIEYWIAKDQTLSVNLRETLPTKELGAIEYKSLQTNAHCCMAQHR
jgi:hypothetical protein